MSGNSLSNDSNLSWSIESSLTNDFNLSGTANSTGLLEGDSSTTDFNLVVSGDDTDSGFAALEASEYGSGAARSNFLALDTEASLL